MPLSQLSHVDYLGITQLCAEWRNYPTVPQGMQQADYYRMYREVQDKVMVIVREYDDMPLDLPKLTQAVLMIYLIELLRRGCIKFILKGDFIKLQVNSGLAAA